MSGNYLELRAQLVQMREYLGIKQETVARRMGIEQSEVSRLERRIEDPHISTVARYVEALGGELELRAISHDGWPLTKLPVRGGLR